ncbi:hypothetical protein AVEN_40986-1 [Araneus ventricosus]|uniref:Uncharacterized protein n=1 Tax=Araneus ventricosus TaxID=182803 RepID=A0A4Y2FCX0_ARAVE|nr:hypothetical protein AVEN_40986-1 [Araneus ventricosus]
MLQLTIRASPAKDLTIFTGSKNTPVSLKFRSRKQHDGVALRVFTSQLSLSDRPLSPSSLFLKHLPSEPRGEADELFLGDSSSAGQTSNRSRAPSFQVIIRSGRLLTARLCRQHVCGSIQTIPHSSSLNPSGFA